MEGIYGSIDADYSSCHGYYIVKISSYPYTFQSDLSIDCQVISFDEVLYEVTYLFSINIKPHY